jgi:hypothetical protein
LGGVSLIELFILLGFPIALAPVFVWLNLNLLFVFALDLVLYALLRMGNRVSGFDYGVISFFSFHFLWPRQLSGFALEEHDYLRRVEAAGKKT